MLLIHWSRLNVYPFTLRLSGSSSLLFSITISDFYFFLLLKYHSLFVFSAVSFVLSENIELLPWLSHPPLSPSLALHNGKP